MKIVADNHIPYIADLLTEFGEVVTMQGESISRSELVDADVLIVRTRTHCTKELLRGTSVRLIATATIGYDHIDTEWCKANGIEVVTAAGCNARAVLQWVSGVLVWLARTDRFEPHNRTLGVIGAGHVGSLVVDYARSWGFEVLCSDPPREQNEHLGRAEGFVAVEELAERSDIVTFHPLLTRTGSFPSLDMGNEALFGHLRSGAVVINASRGEVIDEQALLSALDRGCRCCIDVWRGEPDHLNPQLLNRALLATPHIAGYSLQGKANASAAVVEALGRFASKPTVGWYPPDVSRSTPRPIDWQHLCETIDDYFDPQIESNNLRHNPAGFEQRRNTYPLRTEYF